jgi:hypothetical protein
MEGTEARVERQGNNALFYGSSQFCSEGDASDLPGRSIGSDRLGLPLIGI